MEASNWLVFASVIFFASVSPGPNVLAVVVNTLEAGFKGAVFTIVGNLLALFTIALAAAVGVGLLLQTVPSVFVALKIAGGIYLIWMGVKMLISSYGQLPRLSINAAQTSSSLVSNYRYITRAMFVSYSNPKSILFLSAVFPAFLDDTTTVPLQFGVLFITIICIVSVVHSLYAVLAFRLKDGLLGVRARRLMARFSGISFLGFGAGFVYDAQS